MLINDPMQVAKKVKGIGAKLVLDWQKQLEKMKDSQITITTLLEYGLTVKQAKKLYEKYKDVIVKRIEDNPYILSREVKGFGFLSCDRIARNIGYSSKSSYRLQEGIIHILEKATNSGHCYLPYDEMIDESIELLRIRLTAQEMNEFRVKHSNDFEYTIGNKSYVINFNKMVSCLNSYNNSSKRSNDRERYLIIDITKEDIIDELKILKLQNRIVIKDKRVYLEEYYDAEMSVARHVNRIIDSEIMIPWDTRATLEKYCKDENIELEEKQKEAVIEFASSTGGFHILNGSAGCGKTFTLKVILQLLRNACYKPDEIVNMMLLAPTGKASKVATKATGMECKTIHRGLGYNPEFGFAYNEINPLEADVIIVDESSMLDILLAEKLFQAVKNGAKVILLGDTKQLPSVGAGNVLKDLIECSKIKVVTLDVIKRQGKQSGIIKNANLIIDGKMIVNRDDTKDAYIIKREAPKGVQEAIIQSIKRIQAVNGYSLAEIQVLCPQKGGSIGVEYMNYLLQETFNHNSDENKVLNKKLAIRLDPKKDVITKINLYFKKGDKVIHIKNNYDILWYKKSYFGYEPMGEGFTGITNGECGVIEEIRKGKNEDGETITEVIVKYDDMYIIYDETNEIDHAYALTIHKSQGSQFKAVITPIMMQNYMMLDNNLFYTAYTRAESFVVTIGQENAIQHAVKTYRSRERYTSLKEAI